MKYILEAVQQYPDVKNIFILNRIGRIVISINDKDMGRIIELRDPTCQVCHHGTTKALNKTVIYSSLQGEKIFRNVNPIYNRKECFSCHKLDFIFSNAPDAQKRLDEINSSLKR